MSNNDFLVFYFCKDIIHSSNVIVQVVTENTASLPFKPRDAHISRS